MKVLLTLAENSWRKETKLFPVKFFTWKLELVSNSLWDIVGLLKIKVFWYEGYDVIISYHGVTKKMLSHESNYIVNYY